MPLRIAWALISNIGTILWIIRDILDLIQNNSNHKEVLAQVQQDIRASISKDLIK